MQLITFFSITALLTEKALAYPWMNLPGAAEHYIEQSREKRQGGFDADAQRISTSGQYKFVPPGSGDLRGPCPGLNALANHGYLPHNGYTSLTQAVEATNKVFGMGVDLATFSTLR